MSTYPTPIPGAPGYEQANLLARRAYENAMARLQQKRSRSLLHYGYQRGADGGLSVDPNNEYGAYQQMLRGENQQSHRLDRTQRASGWGTDSGYLGGAREDLQHAQGREQANLGTAFADEQADISQGEQGAAYDRDQALYQNELEAAQRAIEQGNYSPADYSGLDVPAYGEEQAALQRPNVHRQGKQRLIKHAAVQRARARGRRR